MCVCPLGPKNPHLITNWGPAAFTQAELEEREKSWKGKRSTEWGGARGRARRGRSPMELESSMLKTQELALPLLIFLLCLLSGQYTKEAIWFLCLKIRAHLKRKKIRHYQALYLLFPWKLQLLKIPFSSLRCSWDVSRAHTVRGAPSAALGDAVRPWPALPLW